MPIQENKHNNSTFSFVLLVILLVVGTIMSLQLSREKKDAEGFTKEETALLSSGDSVMYVLNVNDPDDEKILRIKSMQLGAEALKSNEYNRLKAKLLATVKAPEYGGVGIAAPQIGVNRRVIAVQRVDKPGEPFEVYPDIQIDTALGNMIPGFEGCLSVPTKRGRVMRYPMVVISYRNPSDFSLCRDTVKGFSAIIFQHECDHLNGVLFIDKADSIFVDQEWKAEYDAFATQGKYLRSQR
ncbi:MAG: peptide deformylase [Bacteroidales bacterium]|nr:peptide deformylase [Bacteroidales bacterium]MDY2935535.1 peptide deformylase [Candidatus Cryptobacteroides sp.]